MKQTPSRLSKRMLFMYCMLGGLIFLFSPPSVTGKLQLAYARIFSWPLRASRNLTLMSRTSPSIPDVNNKDYAKLQAGYRRLKNDVANLNAKLTEARAEIDRLAGLRTVPQWQSMRFQPATIVTATGSRQNELIINRGQEEQVAVGCYVMGMNDHSIIGVISNVSPHGAKVKLVTDPTSKIPVEIGDTRVQGLMQGNKIGLVRATHPIKKGDPVMARRVPGFLDVAVVTAEVIECKPSKKDPLLLDITIAPVCDIANLIDVAVVVAGK